jgi:hypothetical protein
VRSCDHEPGDFQAGHFPIMSPGIQ